MIKSKNGIALVERMTPELVLTESDGPFIEVEGRCIVPADVQRVEEFLGTTWGSETGKVRSVISKNFQKLLQQVRSQDGVGGQT